jgi:hypothetical protein
VAGLEVGDVLVRACGVELVGADSNPCAGPHAPPDGRITVEVVRDRVPRTLALTPTATTTDALRLREQIRQLERRIAELRRELRRLAREARARGQTP